MILNTNVYVISILILIFCPRYSLCNWHIYACGLEFEPEFSASTWTVNHWYDRACEYVFCLFLCSSCKYLTHMKTVTIASDGQHIQRLCSVAMTVCLHFWHMAFFYVCFLFLFLQFHSTDQLFPNYSLLRPFLNLTNRKQ